MFKLIRELFHLRRVARASTRYVDHCARLLEFRREAGSPDDKGGTLAWQARKPEIPGALSFADAQKLLRRKERAKPCPAPCGNESFVFTLEGDFCLKCWRDIQKMRRERLAEKNGTFKEISYGNR